MAATYNFSLVKGILFWIFVSDLQYNHKNFAPRTTYAGSRKLNACEIMFTEENLNRVILQSRVRWKRNEKRLQNGPNMAIRL